jgi:hypothetical protein
MSQYHCCSDEPTARTRNGQYFAGIARQRLRVFVCVFKYLKISSHHIVMSCHDGELTRQDRTFSPEEKLQAFLDQNPDVKEVYERKVNEGQRYRDRMMRYKYYVKNRCVIRHLQCQTCVL